MTFKVVIPARYHSSRLPGKPLVEIAGIPMVIHVARKAKLSGANEIIIATDDDRIIKTSEEYGFRSIMTNTNHISGTDRIEEVIDKANWSSEAIIINLQGDEPLIDPLLINQLSEGMIQDKIDYASAAASFSSYDDFSNPNNVKVVLDHNDYAIYFSRAMIPYQKDLQDKTLPKFVYHHIGIYGYTAEFLRKFCSLSTSKLELTEGLEQLRALENNLKLKIFKYQGSHSIGVDTEEDLKKIKKILDPT
jgi:3-deoxy-manno-octulosonate cytidylyltransferase (CMP-KDO synthetase)